MSETFTQFSAQEGLESGETIQVILERLTQIARQVMVQNKNGKYGISKEFHDNPDSIDLHEPNWHQWGVITHTKKVTEAYTGSEVRNYLEQWGIKNEINKLMREEVDGIPKTELIKLGLALHDVGKFVGGTVVDPQTGKEKITYQNHEAASGEIINKGQVKTILEEEFGFTPMQIVYISKCAELHFKLGDLRDEAKKSPAKYSIKYLGTPEFKSQVEAYQKAYPEYAVEIGLMFLCDSLGKTELRIDADSDEKIEEQRANVEAELRQKQLNSKLVNCILQLPINIKVAQLYLQSHIQREK